MLSRQAGLGRAGFGWALLLFAAAVAGCSRGPAGVEIGTGGGTVTTAADGPGPRVSIQVPEGAVREQLKFSVRQIPGLLPGAAGPAVEATPHGAVFAKPVALRFAPKPEELAPGISFAELRVATLNGGRWEMLPTSFPAPGVIEGLTTHFSTFALVAPCHVAGTTTDFPLSNCPSFTPRIQTSSDASLDISAGGVSVRIALTASTAVAGVDMTVSGLDPATPYYLHTDSDPALSTLTTDSAGVIRFRQDTTVDHLLVLMKYHGSISLSSGNCSSIGIWNPTTRTCTLTANFIDPPVYIVEASLTLDCMDPVSGVRHMIGGPPVANGIYLFGQSDVTIRNCIVANADIGIEIFGGSNVRVENVSTFVPQIGFNPPTVGVIGIDYHGAGATFDGVSVNNFPTGFNATSKDMTVRNATIRARSSPITFSGTRALFEDIALDGTLTGPGPNNPSGTQPVAAVALSNAQDVVVRRLHAPGMGAFDSAIAAVFGSSNITVDGADISGARRGVRFDGPGADVLTGSMLTDNLEGFVALGGTHLVFHNNIYGNTTRQVSSGDALELSDTNAGSPTFGQGNYWGRSCPGALFLAGTDSNAANVVDSHPYDQPTGWIAGGLPGCSTLPPPILTSPVDGSLLATNTPTFHGTAVPGATVEVVDSAGVVGSGTSTAAGTFAVSLTVPLSEGLHIVRARARLGGATSSPSIPVSFTVDTVPPIAPVIVFPTSGITLNDTSTLVAGTAEAGTMVEIREGTTVTGTGPSDASGVFQAPVQLPSGVHTLTAVAQDAAGNRSPPSSAVTFTVRLVSLATPLLGVGGRIHVTSVRDFLDPFIPSLGETNVVQIEGSVLIGLGAQGNGNGGNGNGNGNGNNGNGHGNGNGNGNGNNGNGNGGGNSGNGNGNGNNGNRNPTFQVHLRRQIVSAASGLTVGTTDVTAPVIPAVGPGKPSFIYTVTTSPFDGRDPLGAFLPAGAYLSKLSLTVTRNFPGQGAYPGPCGPATLPVGGPCTYDTLPMLVITFGVLDVPPLIPPPIPNPHFGGDCNTGHIIVELCNGLDDNCNGQIDEGDACQNGVVNAQQCSATGSCVPGCHGATCGEVPDGCGGLITCGGTCP